MSFADDCEQHPAPMMAVYRCLSCTAYVREPTPALPALDARVWHSCRDDVRGVAVLEQVFMEAEPC